MDTFSSIVLIVSLFHLEEVISYPDGKVSMACNNMLPVHKEYTPQNSLAPYSILVSSTTFNPGDQITVTLQANSGITFKGFLLQARTVGGDFIVGTFRITDANSQGLQCGNIPNSAVSQTSPSHKTNLSVIWIAPPGAGYIQFRATFVKSFSKFWDNVESQTILPLQISSDRCRSEKFCFSSPSSCDPATSRSCVFMSSVPASLGGFVFEMSAPSSGYVAIGFSDDTLMGNDDIYICTLNTAGRIEIQHAFSYGRTTPNISSLGVIEGNVTSSRNGVVQCSFITRNKIATPHGNASSSYYIFLTSGPSQDGRILKHPQMPFITKGKVDVAQSLYVHTSHFEIPMKIKVHGALMLIAWMSVGSFGMVFARYLKNIANKPIFGKASWFQAHQCLMVLTLAATITAFVLPFVEARGWSYWCGAHSVMGCIVMILSFFQPIIALFRPNPTHKWRSIFNWFHALNAFATKVVAVQPSEEQSSKCLEHIRNQKPLYNRVHRIATRPMYWSLSVCAISTQRRIRPMTGTLSRMDSWRLHRTRTAEDSLLGLRTCLLQQELNTVVLYRWAGLHTVIHLLDAKMQYFGERWLLLFSPTQLLAIRSLGR